MEEYLLHQLAKIEIGQLIAYGVLLWIFYSRLNSKIDKVEAKLTEKIDKVDLKLSGQNEKLSEKVDGIDKRLCRIEGSLSTHGHCLFNQSKPEQKAQ
jgi:hypothetical protein